MLRVLLSFLVFFLGLSPQMSMAEFKSCVVRLLSIKVSKEFLGAGSSAYVSLLGYKSITGATFYRKFKKPKDPLGTITDDIESANYMAERLSDVPGVKAARQRKVRNPFSQYEVEVEYFPGEMIHKKLAALKKKADDEPNVTNRSAVTELQTKVKAAKEMMMQKIFEDPRVESILYKDRLIPLPKMKERGHFADFYKQNLAEIANDGIDSNRLLTLHVNVKTLMDTKQYRFMIKEDNLLETPEGEIVLVDPF